MLGPALAVNYEVYPGSAFYLPQMLDRDAWSFVATHSNGLYHHPVGFGDLSTAEETTYTGHFTNRFAMVEGDMGSGSTTGDVANLQLMSSYGLAPVAAFVNRPSSNPAVWRQLVRNNAAQGAPSYQMLAPHRLDDTPLGWNDPIRDYARVNMLVPGCIGGGVDAPVHLFVNQAAAYRQSIYDMRDWTVANGRKFNYLISPNNSYDAALLADTQSTVRAMEDSGHEPDVYGVVLYGERPVDLVPEKVNVGGVDRAATTITGLAYWLLKHRDGEPGTLDLSAARDGVVSGDGLTSPVLADPAQSIALSATSSRTWTLRLDNLSPWLDYAGVLRARAAGGGGDWTIAFVRGGEDITAQVLSPAGCRFVGADRWMPGSRHEVTMTVTPNGSPGPLKLVVEALPHGEIDHALDVLAFESGAVGNTPPTLAIRTSGQVTREALPFGPLWFTCGDAETPSPDLVVTATSSNPALVPPANLQLGSSGIQRWLRVVPASGQWGSAEISVTVGDGSLAVTRSFNLQVERTTVLPVTKANNASNLEIGTSWQSGSVPGRVDQAVWDAAVTGPNEVALGADLALGGLKVVAPGGDVTLDGPARLALGIAGVDLASATRDLHFAGPVDLDESAAWSVAANRLVRVTQGVGGVGGIAKSGGGRLELLGGDSFVGGLSVSAGEVVKAGSGAQSSNTVSGNGVLKVSHSGGFGTGGLVLAPANSSTGRVEISGGIAVLAGKSVSLNARSSGTDAVVAVSGENTFGGNVSLATGGGYYGFRSDEGRLTLAGTLASAATGGRNVTLRGAGEGRVTGAVSNGSGTVGLIKSGSGRWTLEGSHSFTGPVQIQQGVFEVDAALPVQTVTVAAAGTLAGNGGLGGAVSIDGTHAPDGVLSVTGPLAYGDTAVLAWEPDNRIDAGTVTIAPGARIDVVMDGPGSVVDYRESVWRTAREWPVVVGGTIGGDFGIGTVSEDASGDPAGPFGAFSLVSTGLQISLHWSPADEFSIWQYENFGAEWDQASIAGAAADPDGDGWTNGDEWIAGTAPRDPASRFIVAAEGLGLRFERSAGRAYDIETATALDGPWTLQATVSGSGPLVVPPPANPGPRRFYRVAIRRVP
jgi:autotransporter-associated beta strand protein